MKEYQQVIQDIRTKGNENYFPLNTFTDKELIYALRFDDYTALEREAIIEEMLERMAR